MSLEKKVSIGMFAALTGINCTGENTSAELGGVTIYETVTDSEGKAHFTEEETGEEVEVQINIKDTDFPVSDATVLYFDNQQSEGFLISHLAFSPQLNIALHNSDHQYPLSLTPAVLPHQGAEKEHSKLGAEKYLSWAEANWEHTGCLTRENMLTIMKPGVFLMKKLGIVETFGFSDEKFDEGVEYIEDNLPESAVAEMYVFVPYKHGFSASTTTITALDIKFEGSCSYGDSGNNQPGDDYDSGSTSSSGSGGNDGSQNNGGSDCSGMLFCDQFDGTALNTSKWNIVNDSGIDVYGGWVSLPNASSIAAQNGFGSSCADKRVDLRGSPLGSVYLGNMGLSANNDTGILSCNGEDAIVNIAGAENGLSLYKSGGLLSLLVGGMVTSVPCSEDISYVQLTAGLNDKVEIDYVKVKCD